MTVVGTGTSAGPPTSVTPRITPPPALGNARSSAPISPETAPPPPSMENERMLYTFRVDKPEAAGTFVMSPLQLSPVNSAGMSFSVYTPPAAAKTAQSYADAAAHILDFYNGEFGALPEPGLKIAQIPDGTVDGYSAPGLLLVSARDVVAEAECAAAGSPRGEAMVGRPGDGRLRLRRVGHGRAGAILRGAVRRADVWQRGLEQGARGFRRGRADVRRRRADRRSQAAGP